MGYGWGMAGTPINYPMPPPMGPMGGKSKKVKVKLSLIGSGPETYALKILEIEDSTILRTQVRYA